MSGFGGAGILLTCCGDTFLDRPEPFIFRRGSEVGVDGRLGTSKSVSR